MTTATASPSRRVRERLAHPVIDADGHTLEYWPRLEQFITTTGREFGCHDDLGDPVQVIGHLLRSRDWSGAGSAGSTRPVRGPWWGIPTRTEDLAAALAPGLYAERLPEAGIDFSVVYPSIALHFPGIDDTGIRRALCRATNRYLAAAFAPYASRTCPVAVIPMHTPDEALEELDYAVRELGMRAAVFAGFVRRSSDGAGPPWLDTFGIDSAFDYTPVWERCVELGVPFASHAESSGIGWYRSPSSYVANHLGTFATASEALAKSLVLGGVPVRHPTLPFVFLEGGVAWAAQLRAGLKGHWQKRNREAVANYDPAKVDADSVHRLLFRYGQLTELPPTGSPLRFVMGGQRPAGDSWDEFARSGITAVDQIDAVFHNFFFGCEGDDPLVPMATLSAPPLRVLFGSDISHWDVPDLRTVLSDAYDLVESGALSKGDFEAFCFANAAVMYARANPDFFRGTEVEREVAQLLEERSATGDRNEIHETAGRKG